MIKIARDKSLILFDGYCHLCSRSVQLILKYDKKRQFLFSPLSSSIGEQIKKERAIPETIDSIILIEAGNHYTHADAILQIANQLGGIFLLANIAKILPHSWRNQLYRWVAAKRFRWFGKRTSCMLPTPEDKDRFI